MLPTSASAGESGERGLTAESIPPSSSDSAPLPAAVKFLRLDTVSSRFCLRISTCASSRRRLSSAKKTTKSVSVAR